MSWLGCIADDFTGATDVAGNLAQVGLRVVQTVGIPADAQGLADADAIVVALKSRTIRPELAVEQSLAARRWLASLGVGQVYFKYCSTFDSTPQGNIGPVTDALLDAMHGAGQGFTVSCPAFPENARTVYQGHLFVGDMLLSDSSMRDHPLTPMTDANLVRVLQAQTRRKVGLAPHAVVSRGATALREHFGRLRAQGVGVAVVDAVDASDLEHLAQAVEDMPLVTAASGLATSLAQRRVAASSERGAPAMAAAGGSRAIVAGSCSTATLAQVAHFRDAGLPVFAIDPLAIARGDDVVDRALQWARPLLGDAPVLVHASADPASVRIVQAELGAERAGALVEGTLSRIAVGLARAGVGQLVVAGGETSGAVIQALAIDRMAIGRQIDPGVPWTSAETRCSPQGRLHLALKSGNFGGTDFFLKAFRCLQA